MKSVYGICLPIQHSIHNQPNGSDCLTQSIRWVSITCFVVHHLLGFQFSVLTLLLSFSLYFSLHSFKAFSLSIQYWVKFINSQVCYHVLFSAVLSELNTANVYVCASEHAIHPLCGCIKYVMCVYLCEKIEMSNLYMYTDEMVYYSYYFYTIIWFWLEKFYTANFEVLRVVVTRTEPFKWHKQTCSTPCGKKLDWKIYYINLDSNNF